MLLEHVVEDLDDVDAPDAHEEEFDELVAGYDATWRASRDIADGMTAGGPEGEQLVDAALARARTAGEAIEGAAIAMNARITDVELRTLLERCER